MNNLKVEGYVFLKYHTYISAEAFHEGESLLFCTLPAIGSSHYVFLYSQKLRTYNLRDINEYDESIMPTNNDGSTVLDALNFKLKQFLIDFDYIVFESSCRDTLKDFTELYLAHNYKLEELILKGNEMIKQRNLKSKKSKYIHIYTNVRASLEWREPILYSEDYMAS